MDVIYKIDGVDLRDYGVYISKSEGLLSLPKPKEPLKLQWKDAHGEVVDQTKRYYEAREIKLDCFIKASSQLEFINRCNRFLNLFAAANTRRLNVSIANIMATENLITKKMLLDWNLKHASYPGIITEIFDYYSVIYNQLYSAYGANAIFPITFDSNTQYTLSVDWKSLTIGTGTGWYIDIVYTDDTYTRIGLVRDGVRIIKKQTSTANKTISLIKSTFGYNGTAYLYNIKLEKGSAATDFYPAPSDLKPLVFEVYQSDNVDVKKEWNENDMIGTFSIKLKEPEPIKKVIKFTAVSGAMQASITLTSAKVLNIYWGDQTRSFDVSGTSQTVTHTYATEGEYYIVITGDIDAITSLTTTGTVIWNKL